MCLRPIFVVIVLIRRLSAVAICEILAVFSESKACAVQGNSVRSVVPIMGLHSIRSLLAWR